MAEEEEEAEEEEQQQEKEEVEEEEDECWGGGEEKVPCTGVGVDASRDCGKQQARGGPEGGQGMP